MNLMTMEDWSNLLDEYLLLDNRDNFCIMDFPGYDNLVAGYKSPEKLVVLDDIDTVEKLEKKYRYITRKIEKWIKKQANDINIRM